ncbi:MAG: leucine-rich repeat protein [Bacteroidaceae bacterium]|nr:leucine-rich repeat protein [Bacteroidaceae bacterium]
MVVNSGFCDEDVAYEVIKKLVSEGGTCETFLVRMDGKQFFMKRIRPEFVNSRQYNLLFEKEYEIGKSISSPYFPKYVSLGRDKDGTFLLMEYILGVNVEEKLNTDPSFFRNEENMLKFLEQLLSGLETMHNEGIAYLDFNPKNIMLTQVGNNVKIVDLGFCMSAPYAHTAGRTVGFAAPEVMNKQAEQIDECSDIYALGLLLQYIEQQSGAKFSRHLRKIMHHCMNTDKSKRYSSVSEVLAVLRKPRQHKKSVIAWLCVLVVAVVAGIGFLKVNNHEVQTFEVNGYRYKVLSREEQTCELLGGEEKNDKNEMNVYILPAVEFKGMKYKVVSIKDSAYFNNKAIRSVYLSEGIKTIGYKAFYGCDSVVTINIPNSVQNFRGAFWAMKVLERVKLPIVEEISSQSFVDDISIEDLDIPEGVKRINLDAFVSCTSLKRVRLPQSLRVIERGVFYNCKSLEEITIPAGVTEIGDYAFYKCNKLRNIYCYAKTPPRVTYIYDSFDLTVHVPEEALAAYEKDFGWSKYNIVPMKAK